MSRKVALLLRMSAGYDRQIMRGIVAYSRVHGPWSFYVARADVGQRSPRIKEWGCDGIVSLVENQKMADFIQSCGVPIIDVPGVWPRADYYSFSNDAKVATIVVDRYRVSGMIIEHFLDRGFRNFAFCGFPDASWSDEHREKFSRRIKEIGHEAVVYVPPRLKRDRVWPREQEHLARWLQSLPKPVALMSCNDDRGRQVIDTCSVAELKVPEEIAVVGVDDDDLVCSLANPPLSSVALNTYHGGYNAAQVLDKMMAGEEPAEKTILIEPVQVLIRASSDILAMANREVAGAVRFIREQATRGLGVNEVAEQVLISRRKLEMSFKRVLGRSVHDEIRRVQIARVCQLLLDTDYSAAEIARAAGFATAEYMSQVFRKEKSLTMRQYRNKYLKR